MNSLIHRLMPCCPLALCLGLWATSPGLAQTLFTDATEGLVNLPPLGAGSIAFADYNNDGHPDLLLATFGGGQVTLLQNESNGRFTDRIALLNTVLFPVQRGGGAVYGDMDNDGDLDLYLPGGHVFGRAPDQLLRNDQGVFRDVSQEANLGPPLPTDNAIWLDYDRDGYLDLYAGHWFLPGFAEEEDPDLRNTLHRNRGDGTFEDVTAAAGLDVQLHPIGGGSVHGMAAGDFDDDGWADLYLGVWQAPNRLFLNNREGGFRDASSPDIADSGKSFGVAVGDIDNDGDLDIFQAGGGGLEGEPTVPSPSYMFVNQGEGQFANRTEEVGLAALYDVPPTYLSENAITALEDIDNDGDLDLLLGSPFLRFFLNNGEGHFSGQPNVFGITTSGFFSFGDYDSDGFTDAWVSGVTTAQIPQDPGLYRNEGNDNHWLQVELVGIESNRNGIGARAVATAGDLKVMREVLGGTGFTQQEPVIQLGLGPNDTVDQLVVRWPSGQEDVWTDIPTDQKIRVFEGRAGYHVVRPTEWEIELPEELRVGDAINLNARVQPALYEADAQITRVVADLSPLGGASDVPLTAVGDGTYRLEPTSLVIEGTSGFKITPILIEQATSLGPYWTRVSKRLRVLPVPGEAEDLVFFDDNLTDKGLAEVFQGDLLVEEDQVYQGERALAMRADEGFAFRYLLTDPADPLVYRTPAPGLSSGRGNGTVGHGGTECGLGQR